MSEDRARLEALQVEARALERALADRPEVAAHVVELEQAIALLKAQAKEAREQEDEAHVELQRLRSELDRPRDDAVRRKWWMSVFAIPAVLAGVIFAYRIAWRLLDVIDWKEFSSRYAPWLLALPLVVNAGRVAVQLVLGRLDVSRRVRRLTTPPR